MILNITLQYVGNKIRHEKLIHATKELELNADLAELLEQLFLSSIQNQQEVYQFYHPNGPGMNFVNEQVSEIFDYPENFIKVSNNIGEHLYNAAVHPKIRGGELFTAKFELNGIEALGIFKVERKETYLKLNVGGDTAIEVGQGINVSKIDKAAIIFNDDRESGYKIQIIDNNKGSGSSYWFDEFLVVKQREDSFFHTQETMAIYKAFVTEHLPEEYEISKIDQADLLNKSLDYFKENEDFEFEVFTKEVIQDDSIIESFSNYVGDYELEKQVKIPDGFKINEKALGKSKRSYKSIIKLDKNFHIYVHGDRELIEQSEDKKGKFYKLYFEQEN